MDDLIKIVHNKIESLKQITPLPEEELRKYYLIKEILKRNDCFLQMNKEDAYNILYNLGFSNPEDIYKNLIQPKKYPDYNKKNYNIET